MTSCAEPHLASVAPLYNNLGTTLTAHMFFTGEIKANKCLNSPCRINSMNWVSPCRVLISVLKQKLPRQSTSGQKGKKMIALTSVKKLQSLAIYDLLQIHLS